MKNNSNVTVNSRNVAFYGLFIALVYVATRFINIPGPTPGGLFHLGNVMAFTIAIVFGKKAGAISGAIGMALFDVTSSFVVWAPFTFIIRLAMGYVIGYLAFKDDSTKIKTILFSTLGIILSTIIMIGGYYIAEVILYGNFLAPLQSIWGNFMQCLVGAIIGLPLSTSLKIAFNNRNIVTEL